MGESVLDVSGLAYTYGDGTEALRGVDVSIAPGERVGLIGENGSGKSTLLMCLSGLFAGEGTIRLEGREVRPGRVKDLQGRVGLVFQSPDDQLFMPTLAEDLAFGPVNLGLGADEVRARVDAVAERLSLTSMLDRPPHHMSMGQKRNAAIASVLVMQPAVLLMDEPSSNLDPRSRRRLMDVLGEIEGAMLIAAHDLELVGRVCSRVILLSGGRVVTDGPTREVLADAALMDAHGLEVWQAEGRTVD